MRILFVGCPLEAVWIEHHQCGLITAAVVYSAQAKFVTPVAVAE
jgi:hypothetical protein